MYIGFWWGNLRGKKPLSGRTRRWNVNIDMDPQVVEQGFMDRIDLSENVDKLQDVVNTAMNLLVSRNAKINSLIR